MNGVGSIISKMKHRWVTPIAWQTLQCEPNQSLGRCLFDWSNNCYQGPSEWRRHSADSEGHSVATLALDVSQHHEKHEKNVEHTQRWAGLVRLKQWAIEKKTRRPIKDCANCHTNTRRGDNSVASIWETTWFVQNLASLSLSTSMWRASVELVMSINVDLEPSGVVLVTEEDGHR
jgi:hypothetical protein